MGQTPLWLRLLTLAVAVGAALVGRSVLRLDRLVEWLPFVLITIVLVQLLALWLMERIHGHAGPRI